MVYRGTALLFTLLRLYSFDDSVTGEDKQKRKNIHTLSGNRTYSLSAQVMNAYASDSAVAGTAQFLSVVYKKIIPVYTENSRKTQKYRLWSKHRFTDC
jgi:hypothetical protein